MAIHIYYVPSWGAFYEVEDVPTDVLEESIDGVVNEAPVVPDGSIEITAEKATELSQAVNAGHKIQVVDGQPEVLYRQEYFSPSTRGFYCNFVHQSMPDDVVPVTAEEKAELLAAQSQGQVIAQGDSGKPVAVDRRTLETSAQTQQRLTYAIQRHLDRQAKAMGYDDIKSAVTYADEPSIPRFQSEGQALRAWRSRVWDAAYAILDACTAGTRATPSAAELITELPVLGTLEETEVS